MDFIDPKHLNFLSLNDIKFHQYITYGKQKPNKTKPITRIKKKGDFLIWISLFSGLFTILIFCIYLNINSLLIHWKMNSLVN